MFYVALFQHDFTLDIIVMFVLTFIFFVSGVYFVTVYVLTRLYFAVYILVALVFIIVLVVNINLSIIIKKEINYGEKLVLNGISVTVYNVSRTDIEWYPICGNALKGLSTRWSNALCGLYDIVYGGTFCCDKTMESRKLHQIQFNRIKIF